MRTRNINIEYIEYDSPEQMNPEDAELVSMAIDISRNAYTPYSKFHVGAAIRLDDGTVVTGCNQENAAYPSGLCAERTAMFYASAHYPDKAMRTIAIAAVQDGKICDDPATPCGACRQVMAEYQTKSGQPLAVILAGGKRIWKFSKVDDLLPLIFDSLKTE